MVEFITARWKAIAGFVSAEAGSIVTLLTATDDPTGKKWAVALLIPLVVPAAVVKTPNKT